jgi:hypothetical protein
MTKMEIIDQLARAKTVEQVVENVTRRHITGDLKDLCQMVYVWLLETDESRIVSLWEKDQIGFYIVRIVQNQYCLPSSRFLRAYRVFGRRTVPIEGHDKADE